MSKRNYVYGPAFITRYRFPTHINDLILDRAESDAAEAFFVIVEPGTAAPLHVHHDVEQIFYVLEGTGILQIGSDNPQYYAIKSGDLVYIPCHTFHSTRCDGEQPLRYLSVDCFISGKPADEPTWDSHVQRLCEQMGWDFAQIRNASSCSVRAL
nr:cupin domain-containing protein [Chloroflexota bacterium]